MTEEKNCIILYKTGLIRGQVYGIRFYDLTECCDKFSYWFGNSGNTKSGSFNTNIGSVRHGLNFMPYFGKEAVLFLSGSSFSNEINFCPFCGTKVEVKEGQKVRLNREYKQLFSGYSEDVIE